MCIVCPSVMKLGSAKFAETWQCQVCGETWQCQVSARIAKFRRELPSLVFNGILEIGLPTFATLQKASSAADRFDVREVVGFRFRSS
jgi:hypothetical protein